MAVITESSNSMQDMVEIIAHRGASEDAPENTLAAVQLGWQQGADAVEFDCRLTRDGRIVVFHDPTTERTTDQSLVVADATFDELLQLDAGTWKDPQWAGERIPAIEDVIATMPHGKRMFVEVKCGAEINDRLVHILSNSTQADEQFAVISYDVDVVAGVKQALPGAAAYLVARFERDNSTGHWTPSVDQLVAIAKNAGLDGLDVRADAVVDQAFVERAREAELATYVWTVDDAPTARRLIGCGVQGLATIRPQRLREDLARAS